MRTLDDGTLALSPSDLSAHLACPHLTTLSLAVAHGELERPHLDSPHRDLIYRKGNEHEASYLARLELAADDAERERRQVRTREVRREVGGREGERRVVEESHRRSIRVATVATYAPGLSSQGLTPVTLRHVAAPRGQAPPVPVP